MKKLTTSALVSLTILMSSCGADSGGNTATALAQQVTSETLPECKPANSDTASTKTTPSTSTTEVTPEVTPEVPRKSPQEVTQDSPEATPVSLNQASLKLTADTCVDPQASEVKSGVLVTLCNGTTITGTYTAETITIVETVTPTPTPESTPEVTPEVTPVTVYSACSQNNQVDCIANSTYQAINPTTIPAAEGHVNCSENNQTGCIATEQYKAANLTNLAAGSILNGVIIAGVTGSVTIPTVPANCAGDNQVGCVTTSTYKSANLDSLVASNLRNGIAVAGVTGTLIVNGEGHVDCTADGQVGCVSTAAFKAVQMSLLTASVLKSGTSVAGVTGAFPSSAYPLTGSSAVADLDLATFTAKIKAAASFEWFGPDGTRYETTGDADITAANIKSSVSVFGTTGTHADIVAPDAFNVRKGLVVNGVTGMLMPVCRLDKTDGSVPAASRCISFLSSLAWTDLTPGGECTSAKSTCMYKSKMSGLTWARSSGALASGISAADSYCANLSLNGITSGWRVPSVSEAAELMWAGFEYAPTTFTGLGETWTTDGTATYRKTVGFTGKWISGASNTNTKGVTCVHD